MLDPQFPELASGSDPVEVAAAVAEDLRALYGGRLRRVVRQAASPLLIRAQAEGRAVA